MTKKNNTAFADIAFPERLKTMLAEKGMTHQDLASILGVQRQTVSLYTNGQIRPDIGALAVIAKALGVTTDWLLGLTADCRNNPVATDELGLSQRSIDKLKSYEDSLWFRNVHCFSAIDMLMQHDDFEELVQSLSSAISSCSEALMAHSSGETESQGEDQALEASEALEGTRWTVITSAKYAEYLEYNVKTLFGKIVDDLTNIDDVHRIMEY